MKHIMISIAAVVLTIVGSAFAADATYAWKADEHPTSILEGQVTFVYDGSNKITAMNVAPVDGGTITFTGDKMEFASSSEWKNSAAGKVVFQNETSGGSFGEVTLCPFNDGWEFRWQDESAWRPAPMPHDAMRDRPFAVEAGHPVRADEALFNQGYRKGGVVTYRKRFRRPADGARLAVRFDGVFADSEVALNGHPIAARHNGYVPFEARLDDLQEDNLLEVRCGAEVPSARWYTGAGLLRDVWLVRRTGWAPEPDAVAVSAAVRDGTAQVEIRVDGAEVVSPHGGRYEIGGVELWSPESPRLYEVEVVARNGKGETGACKVRFGVKTVEFTRDRGLLLNGSPYRLKGVCLHENFGCLGGALNRSALRRQLLEIKSMGANAIRTAHNPFAPAFYDLCDEMGFLVMDEIFDEWETGKTKYGYHRFFRDDALKDLETVVRRDRNHPCLLLWSIGNEIEEMSKPGEDGRRAKDWAMRLATAVRRLDPAHPVTAGCLKTPKVEENGVLSELDVVGLNYNRAAYDELKGRYCILGSETTAVPVSRDAYLFREGADGTMEIVDRANGWTHSAYGASLFKWAPDGLEGSLAIQDRCPWSAGEFVWSAYDYTGEPDTPKPETKNLFWPAVSSPWGIHDLAGFRKDRFYLLKSVWTDAPTAHLLPDWTHPGKTGRRFPVWCYTNAEEGELFLNGKSQGVRRFSETSARHLEWKVAYEPGVLEFTGRMKDGRFAQSGKRRGRSSVTLFRSITRTPITRSSGLMRWMRRARASPPVMMSCAYGGSAERSSRRTEAIRRIILRLRRGRVIFIGDRFSLS